MLYTEPQLGDQPKDPNVPRRGGRAARLANALLADRNRETAETQSVTCAACGRGIVDRGRRCCSPRCEQWLADGNPPVDPQLARKALEVPLRAWTVIAGPPGVVIGSRPYVDLLDALSEKRADRRVRAAPGKKDAKPRFCSKACRTAFDNEGEEARAPSTLTSAPTTVVDPAPIEPVTGCARLDAVPAGEIELNGALSTTAVSADLTIPNDLSVPSFLRRAP